MRLAAHVWAVCLLAISLRHCSLSDDSPDIGTSSSAEQEEEPTYLAEVEETSAPSLLEFETEIASLRSQLGLLEDEKRSLLEEQDSLRTSTERREAELTEESSQLREQIIALTAERDSLMKTREDLLLERDGLLERVSELSALADSLRASLAAQNQSPDHLARLRDQLRSLMDSVRLSEYGEKFRRFFSHVLNGVSTYVNLSAIENFSVKTLAYIEEVLMPQVLELLLLALRLSIQTWRVVLVFLDEQWVAFQRLVSSLLHRSWLIAQPHYDKYLREHMTRLASSRRKLHEAVYVKYLAPHVDVYIIPVVEIMSRKYHYMMYHLAATYYNEDIPRKLYFDFLRLMERLRINVDMVSMELTKNPVIHGVFGSSAFDFSRYFVYSLLVITLISFRSPILWCCRIVILILLLPFKVAFRVVLSILRIVFPFLGRAYRLPSPRGMPRDNQGRRRLQSRTREAAVQRASIGTPSSVGVEAESGGRPLESSGRGQSRVLCLSNMVSIEELRNDTVYNELIEDVRHEAGLYGTVREVRVPRPHPHLTYKEDANVRNGIGRVFVHFYELKGAVRAKAALDGRKYDSRMLKVNYFPEELFQMKVI